MLQNTGSNLPLDTLAATIKAHIARGDASIEKAEQHYKAAGIHLMEAKEQVRRRKDITWPAFLIQHCEIRRSRADELIAIADGRKSLAEVRETKRASSAATYERYKAAATSSGKSAEKAQQNQQSRISGPVSSDDSRRELINKIVAKLESLDLGDLEAVWALINQEE